MTVTGEEELHVLVVVFEASSNLAVDVDVTGAKGFPKTLRNVLLQQLVSFSREQQKWSLKRPEPPQGTASTVWEVATVTDRLGSEGEPDNRSAFYLFPRFVRLID